MGSGASKKAEAKAGAQPSSELKAEQPSGQSEDRSDRPPLPKKRGPGRGDADTAAPAVAKHERPLADAKVDNEEVEEAMAEAISQSASPKKSTDGPPKHTQEAIQAREPAQTVEPDRDASVAPEELAVACRTGEVEVVRAYISRVATETPDSERVEGRIPCEALLDEYGESLLHHAAHGGHREIVRMLLEYGQVQPDIPNARNETALSVACRKGGDGVAMELLKATANPNRSASDGLTPFLAAVLGSASDGLLNALLQAKANLNAQDNRGVGALHSLALSSNMRLMKWLMAQSAELDLQTEHGTTALMLASKRGSEEAVAMLLAAKANPNLSNKAGSTALMQAFSSNMNVA